MFDSHRGQKIFSLPRVHVVPCFPLLGLTPSGLFMGLSSTIIYTSELILCSTIYILYQSPYPDLKPLKIKIAKPSTYRVFFPQAFTFIHPTHFSAFFIFCNCDICLFYTVLHCKSCK